jgi:hypothetical protein
MADKKISALTAASVPLAGSEVLPIVQGGSTVKVSVANLTAGRSSEGLTFGANSGSIGGALLNLANPSFAGSRFWKMQNDVSAYGDWGIYQSTDNTGASYTARLYMDASGNPTVSTGNVVMGTAGKGIDFSANTPAAGMTSELLNWYEEGTYTPTVTAGTGTITSLTATAWYTRIGREVTVIANVTITNAGTGAGNCNISLPFANNATVSASGVGRENAVSGALLQGSVAITGTDVVVRRFDNATPIATNAQIRINITYFV